MGATIALTRSVTFTSELADRRCLRTHKWRRLGTTILVILHARDLGAHLNTAADKIVGSHIKDERNHQVGDKVGGDESTVSKNNGGHKDQDAT